MSVLGIILNCVGWLGLSPEALVNGEYSYIAIAPGSTLNQIGSIFLGSYLRGQIKLFNHLLRIIIIIRNHTIMFKLFILYRNIW